MGSAQSTTSTSEIQEIRPRGKRNIASVSVDVSVEAPVATAIDGPVTAVKDASLSRTASGRKSSADPSSLPLAMIEDSHVISDSDSESDSDFFSDSDEDEEWNERLQILQDAKNLRKMADLFMFPEKPVHVDGFSMGRNFFSRPSAATTTDTTTDLEMQLEQDMILADANALKALAIDYLHPERPVETTDPCATGRNYFTRPSAPISEDDDERSRILQEAQALKKLAVDYLHPERPVKTTDPCATGRNYFTRPSAPEYEDEDTMDDRDEILQDMAELKRLAQDFLMPERPVHSNPLLFGRNYFSRPSAPTSTVEEDTERFAILADMQALKTLANDYLHPERPVITSNPYAMGRNFFTRPSAPRYDDHDFALECEQVLQDMTKLKQLAVDYLHPERPVVTSDPYATGRNYFTRPSAPIVEDEDERTTILQEMSQLKQLAVDFLHPEIPVVTSDPYATGRNYFSRLSAPTSEEEEEHDQVLMDMAQLKKLAINYLHPQLPVKTASASLCARNYFDRASAAGHKEQIHSQGHAIIDPAHEADGYGYYHYNPDNHVHHDHQDQSDHFEMDEDMSHEFEEFRSALKGASGSPVQDHTRPEIIKEEGEGNLSRSPSDVMLFEEMGV